MTAMKTGLSPEQADELGRELDKLRDEVLGSIGENDAKYIRRVIATQRGLEVLGRGLLFASSLPPAWVAGTAVLSVAKILENMEIGHNVMHGQWDWMRDPKIHSTTWEWDNTSPAEQWKHSHNFIHHTYTNVIGKDRDVGYALLRVSPDQRWHWSYLGQPVVNAILAMFFEYGVALHDLEMEKVNKGQKSKEEVSRQLSQIGRKVRKQVLKDYVAFPLLTGPQFFSTLSANFTANIIRNVWAHSVIFCGHFPDGISYFTEEQMEGESRGEWYVRQILGSGNITGGKAMHMMTGNLDHQIEHHLFPDMPSNRYAEIAPRIRELCEKYNLPYNTGSLPRQVGSTWKKVVRLAFPGPGKPAPRRKKPQAGPQQRQTA